MVAAGLVSKALDRAEDEAVEEAGSALARLVGAVRAKLSGGSREDAAVMAGVEAAPDSPKKVDALARALVAQAEDEAFRSELERFVDEVKASGVNVGSIAQNATGGSVQIAGISDSVISVKTGV